MEDAEWKIEYANDVGADDDYFVQWWSVTNGQSTFNADTKQGAEWLCALLNTGKFAPPSDKRP